MCRSVYAGLSPLNVIRKHFLQVCLCDVSSVRSYCSFHSLSVREQSRKTYWTRKTRSSIQRTIVSKNWIKQLNTLPVLHFDRCLTAGYSEMSRNYSALQQQLRYWQPNLRRLRLTGYPLLSPVSPLLLPCVTVCHHSSTGFYRSLSLQQLSKRTVFNQCSGLWYLFEKCTPF